MIMKAPHSLNGFMTLTHDYFYSFFVNDIFSYASSNQAQIPRTPLGNYLNADHLFTICLLIGIPSYLSLAPAKLSLLHLELVPGMGSLCNQHVPAGFTRGAEKKRDCLFI